MLYEVITVPKNTLTSKSKLIRDVLRIGPFEPEKLDRILEAAILAPTAANRQAFRVHVLGTHEHKDGLSKVYGRSWFVQAPIVMAVVRNNFV